MVTELSLGTTTIAIGIMLGIVPIGTTTIRTATRIATDRLNGLASAVPEWDPAASHPVPIATAALTEASGAAPEHGIGTARSRWSAI